MREVSMLQGIAKRELLVLDGMGMRLQGTYHRPAGGLSVTSDARDSVGILFVNSLSLPRAASGDSAVHWADAIAALGYPTFRIDLPGLGDSAGQASTDLLDRINAGEFTPVTAAVIKELVGRFALSGIVVFGHCAGSVSAVYAGAASGNCKGLILLDPYFHLPQAKRPRIREELSGWARRSKVGGLLSNLYDRTKKVAMKMHGGAPPGNANMQLLVRWKQLATAGMPVLLLKAPGIKAQGAKPRLGEFDYIEYVVRLAGRRNRVSAEFVEGADHSFANCAGREAVQQHITGWLARHFPLAEIDMRNKVNATLPSSENSIDSDESQRAAEEQYCAVEDR